MEDFDILNKFDNDKLIDVVKNYKRYGYDDELRDYAINLLGERGWNREDLQQFGYLTNHDYDEAEKQYVTAKKVLLHTVPQSVHHNFSPAGPMEKRMCL